MPSAKWLAVQVTVTSWLDTAPAGAAGAALEIVFEPIAPEPVGPTDQAASPCPGKRSAAAPARRRQRPFTPDAL